MATAIYVRVSSNRQETRSQETDLKSWAETEERKGDSVRWFREKASGTNFERSEVWAALVNDLNAGRITRLVVWRLDRLGRNAAQTITLLDELEAKGIGFLSIRDGFDPSTPAGRLTRNVLASVAQFETEVRRERQLAGIRAAKESGKHWGGRKAGTRVKLTQEKEEAAKRMHTQGDSISKIGRTLGLTRQTVYKALGLWERKKEEAAS